MTELRRYLVVGASLLAATLLCAPVSAQDDPSATPADTSITLQCSGPDPADPCGFNAPYPVADQSITNWWERDTVDWRLQAQVRDSFVESWQLRTQARRWLDDSLPPRVMSGAPLQRELDQIHQLKAKGHAEALTIQHNLAVWEAVQDEGVVYDAYQSTSHEVDAKTGKVVGPDSGPEWNYVAYRLQKPDGGDWKIVDTVHIDNHDSVPTPSDSAQTGAS